MVFEPSAEVIADSVSTNGHRLTTMIVRMHRFILPEFNTHRAFTRNSSSSRAVSSKVARNKCWEDRVEPLVWSTEQRGMVGGIELSEELEIAARAVWAGARDTAIDAHVKMCELGVHKSIANRLIEPFQVQTVLVSSTEWNNFFEQRCNPSAQPEMRIVAEKMREAIDESEPMLKTQMRWHTPFITCTDRDQFDFQDLLKISAARCARVSYLTLDGRRDPEADIKLFDRLAGANPPHRSPMEHVATPGFGPYGNFNGWIQLRHLESLWK